MSTDTRKRVGGLLLGLALLSSLVLFSFGKRLLLAETHTLPHAGVGYTTITTVRFVSPWLLIPVGLLAAGTFLLRRRTVTPPPLPPH